MMLRPTMRGIVCLHRSLLANLKLIEKVHCGATKTARFQQKLLIVNCALDVGTDFLGMLTLGYIRAFLLTESKVISIPTALLWNMKMPLRRKLVLIGIFSMTILVIAVSIIRVTEVYSKNMPSDISWLFFWSDIELAMGMTLSSSYALFSSRAKLIQTYSTHSLEPRIVSSTLHEQATRACPSAPK